MTLLIASCAYFAIGCFVAASIDYRHRHNTPRDLTWFLVLLDAAVFWGWWALKIFVEFIADKHQAKRNLHRSLTNVMLVTDPIIADFERQEDKSAKPKSAPPQSDEEVDGCPPDDGRQP